MNFEIEAQNRTFEVLENKTMHQEDENPKEPMAGKAKTSIVFARFLASPEVTEYYGDVVFIWEGPVIKEGFSDYIISIPLTASPGDTHEKVFEHCPNASIYCAAIPMIIGIQIPEGCEYTGSMIPPNIELAMSCSTQRNILWKFTNPTLMGFAGDTNHFTMSFENNREPELRDRLLFDSGLYMGLGVSLIFGGVYEALKIGADVIKDKRKSSNNK